MKNFNIRIIMLISFMMISSEFIIAQPGLDNTFAGTGYKITKIAPSRDDIARTVLVQPNGRILTGGNSFNMIGYSNIAIARFKPNGTYDNTFGVAGIASITGGFFCDMALLPSGKIIVAGSGVGPTNVNNYIVYRLNKNGSLDNTFGTGGSVEINIPYTGMICYDVAIQPDGKIVLAGYAGGSGGYGNMLIVRLKANGNLDNSFATGGKYILYLSGKHSECHELAILPDGKIVAGGYIDTLVMHAFFRYDFGAIRLNSNGTLDNTFGTAGIVRADKGNTDIAYATKRLSDGRIVMAGISNYLVTTRFTALCLLPDGSIDNSFGTDGWLFLDFFGGSSFCNSMEIEGDDDIILGGNSSLTIGGVYQSSLALAKISSSGIPDNTFGISGLDTSFNSSYGKSCNSIDLQMDGKILIGGYIYSEANSSYLTARYTNSIFMMRDENPAANISNLRIYPNPVIGNSFQCSYELTSDGNVRISIINVNGVMIYQENSGFRTSGIYNQTITIPEGLPPGNYFLRIDNGLNSITQKILVLR